MAVAELVLVGFNGEDVVLESLIESIRKALVIGLKVPADDPTVVATTIPLQDALLPHQLKRMILIRITMFSGRTAATRAGLHAILAETACRNGIAAEEVLTVFIETPMSNWGIGGIPQSSDGVAFDVYI